MKIKETEEKKENVSKEISKLIDKKTSTRVFRNLIIAIAIMVYFCVMAKVYENVQFNGITNIMKVTTAVFLVITIILIEIAYKKESKGIFIHSMEMLALAVHSLTTIYVIRINNFDFPKYILFSSFIFSIFFVLKTIIINTKARKEYLKELSDIPNIVKKEEPVVKEAKKKKVEDDDEKINEIETIDEKDKIKVEKKKEIKEKDKKDIKEKVAEKIKEDIKEIEENDDKKVFVDEQIVTERKEIEKKFNNRKLEDIRAKLRELQKTDVDMIDKDKKEQKIEEQEKKEEKIAGKKKIAKSEENNLEDDKIEDIKVTTKENKAKKTKNTKNKKEEKSDVNKKVEDNKEEIKKENEEKKEPSKKKRGRPKKEVKVND